MQSKATTVAAYLASLPEDRRRMIEAVRKVILDNLDGGYAEGMSYGMIGYFVPHRVYPKGYHCNPEQPLPFAGLASQKQHCSLYLMGLYCGCVDRDGLTGHARWLREAWAASGSRLDCGKACIRFKTLEDLPLKVIAEAIQRLPARTFIAEYEAGLAATRPTARKPAPAAKAGKPAPPKKAPASKAARKPAKKAARATAKKPKRG